MTNEKDNDQLTNNQFAKGKDKTNYLYRFGYWLLSICLVIEIWSLVILSFDKEAQWNSKPLRSTYPKA